MSIYVLFETNKELDSFNKYCFKSLVQFINHYIGAKTDCNYQIKNVCDLKPMNNARLYFEIPLQAHKQNENKTMILFNKRREIIKETINSINWNIQQTRLKWIMKYFKSNNIIITYSLTDNIDDVNYSETIQLNNNVVDDTKIKITNFDDGSIIKQIIVPDCQDYGVYVNISQPFEEMGFGYNYLHVFEHIMCIPWGKISVSDLIMMNGSTFFNGLSYVYALTRTKKSLKLYFNEVLNHIINLRSDDYYKVIKDEIDLQTKRTFSESQNDRSLVAFGRSETCAFDKDYNINVFKYWANKGVSIVILTPELINIKKEKINNILVKSKRNINKPKIKMIDYIPFSVFNEKEKVGYVIKKMNKNLKIDDVNNAFLGLDNYSVMKKKYSGEDYSMDYFNLMLSVFMLCNNPKTLKKYIKNNILPYKNLYFGMLQMFYKNKMCLLEMLKSC